MIVPSATRTGHRDDRHAGLLLGHAERSGEVEEGAASRQDAAGHQHGQARQPRATGSCAPRGCPCPRPRGRSTPRPARAVLGAGPSRTRKTSRQHRQRARTTPSAITAERELVDRHGDPGDHEAGDDCRGSASSRPGRWRVRDLRRRDEVRHVALERALGEVRAELEEGDERGDRDQVLARRAIPARNTRSSIEPMTMYGLRRPQRRDRVVGDRCRPSAGRGWR